MKLNNQQERVEWIKEALRKQSRIDISNPPNSYIFASTLNTGLIGYRFVLIQDRTDTTKIVYCLAIHKKISEINGEIVKEHLLRKTYFRNKDDDLKTLILLQADKIETTTQLFCKMTYRVEDWVKELRQKENGILDKQKFNQYDKDLIETILSIANKYNHPERKLSSAYTLHLDICNGVFTITHSFLSHYSNFASVYDTEKSIYYSLQTFYEAILDFVEFYKDKKLYIEY